MKIQFREGNPKDLPFIKDSWAMSYRELNITRFTASALSDVAGEEKSDRPQKEHKVITGVALVPKELYFDTQKRLIDSILEKSKIIVACNPNDIGQILGYIIYRDEGLIRAVSYMYVKHMFRRLGIGTELMKKASPFDFCTHAGVLNYKFLKNHKIIYNPYYDLKLLS